jgi:hypothetical protein
MRWDIEHTRQVIGYVARDGHVAVSTPAIEETEQLVRLKYELLDRFERICAKW